MVEGTSCDYAVNQNQLATVQQLKNGNVKQPKFKTTEVVGLQFNDTEFIREVDLNEISDSNPFIYKLM